MGKRLQADGTNLTSSLASSIVYGRLRLLQPNCLIWQNVGNEMDTDFSSVRTPIFNRIVQFNECLPGPAEETTPQLSLRVKKWLATNEPRSRGLVMESITIAPNSATRTANDRLSFLGSQTTTQLRTELSSAENVALHRSHSEMCIHTLNADLK